MLVLLFFNAFPRDPHQLVSVKQQIGHSETGGGKESIQFLCIPYHLREGCVIRFRQIASERVETEFAQHRLGLILLERRYVQADSLALSEEHSLISFTGPFINAGLVPPLFT